MGLIDNVNVNVGGNGNIIDTLSTYVTKVLKPNIVDGKNVLTQEMMFAANTKYVIKYDYTLGEDITVPANCVLEFDGGSVCGNGSGKNTLTGDCTTVRFNNPNGIFKDIVLDGSFTNSSFSIRNWGITDEVNTGERNSIILTNYVIPSLENVKADMIVPNGNYYFNTPIVANGDFSFICDGKITYVGGHLSTAITIGKSGEYTKKNHRIKLELGYDIRQYYTITDGKYVRIENYGVKFVNITDANIYLDYVCGFCNNILLEGNVKGFQLNNVYLGDIEGYACRHVTLQGKNGGWINENLFIGGHIKNNDDDAGFSKKSSTAIYIKGYTTHPANNNVFIKPCLECNYCGVYFEDATYNTLFAARIEAVPLPTSYGNGSINNTVLYGIATSTTGTAAEYTPNLMSNSCLPLNKLRYAQYKSIFNSKIMTLSTDSDLTLSTTKIAAINMYISRNGATPAVVVDGGGSTKAYGIIVDTTNCKDFILKSINPQRFEIIILDDSFNKVSLQNDDMPGPHMGDYLSSTNGWQLSGDKIRSGSNVDMQDVNFTNNTKYMFIATELNEEFEVLAANNKAIVMQPMPLNDVSFVPTVANNVYVGQLVYVSASNKFMGWNSTAWVDATGTPV